MKPVEKIYYIILSLTYFIYITSFIGVFPAEQPNYLTFVLFDEPKRNIYGKNDFNE